MCALGVGDRKLSEEEVEWSYHPGNADDTDMAGTLARISAVGLGVGFTVPKPPLELMDDLFTGPASCL